MILRPFLYDATGCASYLFGCLTHGRLAVVDPHGDRALSGNPFSTIGFERRHNATLNEDREAFAAGLLRDVPPAPAEQAAIVAANRRGPAAVAG